MANLTAPKIHDINLQRSSDEATKPEAAAHLCVKIYSNCGVNESKLLSLSFLRASFT